METTICFLNDKIIALSGKLKGKHIYINNYRVFDLSEGSIINGVITNNYSIKEVLRKIKFDKTLYFKNVNIVLDSNSIYIKKAIAPNVSKTRITTFVENEFVGFDSKNSEMVFDYSIINPHNDGRKSIDVVCYAIEKSLIKSFIDIFAEEKIKINGIDVSSNCVMKYASKIKKLDKKTYVIANVDRSNIALMLFVDNSYYYSTRARLLADVGTEDYFQEISSHISSIIQFNKSQRNGFNIEDVYICGLNNEENSFCTRYISDLGVSNSSTYILNSIVHYNKMFKSINPPDFIYNLGCLIRK